MFRRHAMIAADPTGPPGDDEDQDDELAARRDLDALDDEDGDLTNLAGMADQFRYRAARDLDRAAKTREHVREALDAAEREAAAITDRARAAGQTLTADAVRLERRAADLDQRATSLAHAADLEQRAADADDLVTALDAEAAELATQVAVIDGNLTRLNAERTTLDAARDQARAAGDLDGLQAALVRADAIVYLHADYGTQRHVLLERAQTIGQPDGTGELGQAQKAASEAHGMLCDLLDRLHPDRPGAERRRVLAEAKNALAGNRQRITAEREQANPRRVIAS